MSLLDRSLQAISEELLEVEARLERGLLLIAEETLSSRRAKMLDHFQGLSEAHFRLWLAKQVVAEGWQVDDLLNLLWKQRYVIFWSETLNDRIAFLQRSVKDIPEGTVVYTESELRELFGKKITKSLKLVHEAKKMGAKVKHE